MKPISVNILGIEHTIEYKDNPSEVDLWGRQALWGEYDTWTRSIRVYDNGRPLTDILSTLLHEILHGISVQLHLKCFDGGEGHDELDLIAIAMSDVLVRNEWIKLECVDDN